MEDSVLSGNSIYVHLQHLSLFDVTMFLASDHKIVRIWLLAMFVSAALATDFDQCIKEINNGTWGLHGGTDNKGRPMDITKATAITYDMCVDHCGPGPEPFSWSVFSQQFSAWLLPWLALISQLPFGANDKIDNLDSMLLSVGSPVLAAYSLVLTTLNGRWITRYFFPFKQHPNAYRAVRVLSSLQQAPLRISGNYHLLEALVTLPENRKWWRELMVWLDMTHTWSISAATSISWVLIAYVFTVIDSFTGGVTTSVNANGQGVGSIWLWLLPIVVGWLQISPKCDSKHLYNALDRANAIALVPTSSGNRLAEKDTEHAIYLSSEASIVRADESRSPPIFNYARLFAWVQAVEEVADVFRYSLKSPTGRQSFSPSPASSVFEPQPEIMYQMVDSDGMLAVPLQRRHRREPSQESRSSVLIVPVDEHVRRSRWGHGTWKRIFIAGCLALFLQWGTTGAAVVVVWYTPTTGLGCRSGAYILYGIVSTLVWMAMLLSSILGHYAATAASRKALSTRVAELFSIFLRRLGKFGAACNAIGLVITCLFQFSNYFNRCYCNSSVLYWGKKAYDVIMFMPEDVAAMRTAWIGGVALAAGSAFLFFLFVNLHINPSFPRADEEH